MEEEEDLAVRAVGIFPRSSVIPAKAGIQRRTHGAALDPRLRGDDDLREAGR